MGDAIALPTRFWVHPMISMTLDMLHAVYGGPCASKRMARDGGVSHQTAEKWWARITTPRADVMMRMATKNRALRAEMQRAMLGGAYAGLVSGGSGADSARNGDGVAPGGGTAARLADQGAIAGTTRRFVRYDIIPADGDALAGRVL